ncbi:hypothetical protein EYF80_048796 [Liparis tanakae]|uniref:Uncharacterized protein n=1 Tax=Liparis tanakae TaxID=230148 RepID=A0A4Z2FII1_9TELE|nr:hypothetical protein EYF80_048796 [Liparis tanakae]
MQNHSLFLSGVGGSVGDREAGSCDVGSCDVGSCDVTAVWEEVPELLTDTERVQLVAGLRAEKVSPAESGPQYDSAPQALMRPRDQ